MTREEDMEEESDPTSNVKSSPPTGIVRSASIDAFEELEELERGQLERGHTFQRTGSVGSHSAHNERGRKKKSRAVLADWERKKQKEVEEKQDDHDDPEADDSDEIHEGEGDYTEEELAKMTQKCWNWLRTCPHHSEFAQPTFVKIERPAQPASDESKITTLSYMQGNDNVADSDQFLRVGSAEGKSRWSTIRTATMVMLKVKLNEKNVPDQPWLEQARHETIDFVYALEGHRKENDEDDEHVSDSDKYNPRSLFCLKLDSMFRRAIIAIIEWPAVDYFIMFVICANVVVMALEDPLSTDTKSFRLDLIEICSVCFVVIFAIEAALKIIAYGFFLGPHAYLKDRWNFIDFFIVISGLLDILDSFQNGDNGRRAISSVRLLRPLRILRAVGRFAELRILVSLILSCAVEMLSVLGMISVLVLTFGMTCFQIWQGSLRGRCYHSSQGTIISNAEDHICSTFESTGLGACPYGYQCLDLGGNPLPGVVHFDNVGMSILSTFQMLTAQGWIELMWNVEVGYSSSTNIVFILLIVLGPLFLLKLIMVVIANRYAAVKLMKVQELGLNLFELRVGIIEAEEMPRMDLLGTADGYVVMQIGNKTKQTRVIKNSAHPKWYEYHILPVEKTTSVLVLKMFDWNLIGAHDFIGEIAIPVGNFDEHPMGSDRWYEMTEEDTGAACGILRVQLQWRKNRKSEWSPLPDIVDLPRAHETEDEGFAVSKFFLRMAMSQTLTFVVIATVLFNVLIMAIEHECAGYEYCFDFRYITEALNVVFAIIFAIEMLIKVLGIGFVNYCKETDNMLYVFVVGVGIAELPFIVTELTCLNSVRETTRNPYGCESNQLSIIRIFRLVRLFRIGRLIDFFPQLKQQLTVMARTVMAVGSLIVLMSCFVVCFAILGMNIFAGKSMVEIDMMNVNAETQFERGCWVRVIVPPNWPGLKLSPSQDVLTGQMVEANLSENKFLVTQYATGAQFWAQIQSGVQMGGAAEAAIGIDGPRIIGLVPRSNFDTFGNSVLTTFQISTLSGWNDIWYSCTQNKNAAPFIYFFFVIIIGNYMLFNLFAAIIIQGFAEQREELDIELKEAALHESEVKARKEAIFGRTSSSGFLASGSPWLRAASSSFIRTTSWEKKKRVALNDDAERTPSSSGIGAKISGCIKRVFCCAYCFVRGQKVAPQDDGAMTAVIPDDRNVRTASGAPDHKIEQRFISSFFFLSAAIIDNLTLTVFQGQVFTSDIELEQQIITYSTTICLGLAAIDFVIRCVRFEKFTASWNKIDLVVMLVTVPEVIFLWTGQLAELQPAFLYLRAFRPLRVILRSENLRIFAQRIKASAKPLINTFFIVLFCFAVLGIVGVSQLSGKMSYCSDTLISTKQECVGFSLQGLARHWKPRDLNFDWIGKAIVTMFVVATKDRWTELMYQAVDAQDARGFGPYQNTSPGYFLLYIFAVFIGGFLLLNIFAGVVVDTHKTFVNSKRKELQVEHESKAVQQQEEKMPRTKSRSRHLVRTIVQRFEFDILMLSLIIFDVVGMSFMSYKASKWMVSISAVANIFFTCVYSAEAMAKIYAFYGRGYLRNSWNVFEFLLVLISVWGICLEYLNAEALFLLNSDSFVRVLRIFRAIRVTRAFRLLNFQAVKNVQALAACLTNAIGHVIEVLGTLFVVYLVFGNITVGIFGNMCDNSNSHISWISSLSSESAGLVPRCMLVDENDLLDGISFSSVPRACVILLTMNTADSWSYVMRRLALSPGVRKLGEGAVSEARIQILNYFETRDISYLSEARAMLPGCQTVEELEALSDVLDCSDHLSNQCASTCGSMSAAYVVCVLFVCLTSLVVLNLLLAVLMQSLQEHQEKINNEGRLQDSRKSGNNVNLLMNVSKAATGWRNAHFKGIESDSDDDGPVFAGVHPIAMMNREASGMSMKQINSSQERNSHSRSETTSPLGSLLGEISERNRVAQNGSRNASPAHSPIPRAISGMRSWSSRNNLKRKVQSEIVGVAGGNEGSQARDSPTQGAPFPDSSSALSPIPQEAGKIPSDLEHVQQTSARVPVDEAAESSDQRALNEVEE